MKPVPEKLDSSIDYRRSVVLDKLASFADLNCRCIAGLDSYLADMESGAADVDVTLNLVMVERRADLDNHNVGIGSVAGD